MAPQATEEHSCSLETKRDPMESIGDLRIISQVGRPGGVEDALGQSG